MPSDFEFFYEKNEMDYEEGRLGCERSYVWEMKRRQEKNGVYHSRDWTEHGSLDPYPGQLNTLAKVLEVFMFLMGWKAPNVILIGAKTPYTPLSPEMQAEMRNERKKAQMYSKTAVIIGREKLETGEDALNYLEKIDIKIYELVKERKKLYYQAGKQESGEDKLHYLAQIDLINQQLKTYRYEKKCIYNLLERCDIMKEMIDNEMQMRREKREREYKKDVPVVEKQRDERSEEREYYPRYTPPAKPKRKRDDFER